MGWVAEEKFGGETTDFDASAADGVKEVGVGGGSRGSERHIYAASLRLEMGGVVGLMEKAEIRRARLGEWGGG